MQRFGNTIFFLLIALSISVSGQNYISNPYTRYGLGDLINNGTGYNRSLGGSSVAIRPVNQINYLNPAAYTSQDTLSFLFQAGVSGQRSYIVTDRDSNTMKNMNIEYLIMGFPIAPWCKMSLGLTPFSRVSYDYIEYQPVADDVAIQYQGDGGLNDFYIGSAFQPTKYLSLGINASYLFGNISRTRMIDVPSATVAGTKISEKYIPGDLHYRFGLQFFPTISDKKERKHRFLLGVIYDLPMNMKVDFISSTSRNFPSHATTPISDTFNVILDSTILLNLPAKFGAGLSYSFDDKLLLTAEFTRQNFSKGIGMNTTMDLNDYTSYRFGLEYVPSPMSKRDRAKYYERIHYCIGGHYTNTYLNIANTPITDYGFSVGLSVPWRNAQKLYTYTMFNLSYEYGVRGTNDHGLIKENYHVISLAFTLHDYWFLQSKYD